MNPGDLMTPHVADIENWAGQLEVGDVVFLNGYDGAYLVWHADHRGMVVERIGATGGTYVVGRHPDQLASDDRLMLYRAEGDDLVDHVSSVAVLAT